jgi:hypothetical protein
MTIAASTTAQIRAQVAAIYKRRSDDRIIGIRTGGRWAGAEREVIGGEEFRIVQCDSPLEIRQRLVESASDAAPLVVVTNLSDQEIGLDLLVRFTRRRFHGVHPWPIVQELFQARRVNHKLLANRWLAEALLESVPAQGYKPVATGMLDQETVWAILLRERMGLAVARPDARDLLAWTLEPEHLARYSSMPLEMREAVRDWIRQSAGSVADLIFACVEAGYGEDAAPIGLACLVIFGSAESELREAAIRLERFTGDRPIAADEAKRWADATIALVERADGDQSSDAVIALAERADQILKEVRADAFAYLSQYSPAGLNMRLERFGQALQATLQSKVQAVPDDLLALAEEVFAHHEARRSRERVTRVEMALRLLDWMAQPGAGEQGSFADAAHHYQREGGFVDRARYSLDGGDSVSTLAQAYARLAEMATARRELENKQFAELLVNWTEAGSISDSLLGVENLLREVVARAAQAGPVLLVVIDGMSMAVFGELIEDIVAKGWLPCAPEGERWPRPVISALPSVTEISRTSLFCGRLAAGTSKDEMVGFSKNPTWLDESRQGNPPVLFHKASLSETSGFDLAADVRKEIASEKRKIVGVVVNAVDDHLAKGSQVAVPWTLRHLPVLDQLLYAARDRARTVIITSDHGHVIERQTTYRKSEPGERYRNDDGKPLADELLIAGSRVIGPMGNRLIAPWSEAVRYGVKKHGYHGGLTPQECVIPLAVLMRPSQMMKGWTETPPAIPKWWKVNRRRE